MTDRDQQMIEDWQAEHLPYAIEHVIERLLSSCADDMSRLIDLAKSREGCTIIARNKSMIRLIMLRSVELFEMVGGK